MGLTASLARACSAHPWRTLGAWGAALLAAGVLVATLLNSLTTDSTVVGNPESQRAADAIFRAFPPSPKQHPVSDVVIVRSDRYTVDSPAFKAFLRDLVARGQASHKIFDVRSYLTSKDPSLVSRDRHAAAVPLLIPGDSDAKQVVEQVQLADRSPDFSVAITGRHTVNNDFNTLSQRDLEHGELLFGLPAALVILLLVFGAVVAGLVPLAMAILSIAVALGLVALLSQAFDLSIFIVNMLTGMGLALGIDYSLFVISRYREERAHGMPKEDAIVRSGATASRAVLFSGSAFVVALLGMLIVPTTIMRSLAAGAILVGIVSVAAALTLLPALLGLLGDRVNAGRVPVLGRNLGRTDTTEGRFWRAIVDRVLRRPALSLALAAGLLIAAAVPIFGLHIGASGVSTLPNDLPSKQGYLALQRDFPRQNPSPVEIVVQGANDPHARSALERVQAELARDPRFGRGAIRTATAADTAVLTVPVRGDEVGEKAVAAVRELRARILPRAFAGTGARVEVGGKTAENVDYFDAVTNPAPWVFAFVLGLSLILLTVAFRSIVVALISIVLNLLSVGAAYGLLVLVFLHGIGAGLLGFQHVAAVDAWVPLFLFSVLFGLSMDYQVFLLSRIKERYDRSGSTTDAVAWGVASTARIITGAALIIVAVFSGFARGDLVMFQQMGFGIAVALLLDATLIRSVVLPSIMQLLGDRCWYLPRWLEWLPHVEVEGPVEAPPVVHPG
ncbi:MAG: putative drug exporter of the superfamily [Gaiellaceae bacterium]|nr:putative drug exporter of the superfamily [Gaiellaceae bacterium]